MKREILKGIGGRDKGGVEWDVGACGFACLTNEMVDLKGDHITHVSLCVTFYDIFFRTYHTISQFFLQNVRHYLLLS